ncbi:MAG: carbohydrate kinase family protein [Eubacteriales bacterium]|nr:carbohydrate kinase family protein [Eubacteriales bacterium]
MDKQLDVVVIGNIINETIKFPNKTIGPVLGSPAAYSSLVMSAVGTRVGLVSYYGSDTSEWMSQQLDDVDHTGLILHERSTTNFLHYRKDGTKYVEYVYKAPDIFAKDIPREYLDCDYFYICPMDYEVDISVNKMLYEMGKNVVVDLGGYGGATSKEYYTIFDAKGDSILSEVAKYSTIIKASREDLTHIAPGMNLDSISRYFFSKGAKICVVTLGEKGSYLKKEGEQEVQIESFMADNPIDFTGAGDSFGAGFMASLSQEPDINKAIIYGNAVASLVIEKTRGCIKERMPSFNDVENRINQIYERKM